MRAKKILLWGLEDKKHYDSKKRPLLPLLVAAIIRAPANYCVVHLVILHLYCNNLTFVCKYYTSPEISLWVWFRGFSLIFINLVLSDSCHLESNAKDTYTLTETYWSSISLEILHLWTHSCWRRDWIQHQAAGKMCVCVVRRELPVARGKLAIRRLRSGCRVHSSNSPLIRVAGKRILCLTDKAKYESN